MKGAINGADEVLVFVPSYNDMDLVGDVVNGITALPGKFRVLVIDDGSTVGGRLDWAESEVLFVRLGDNFGLGTGTHIALDHMLRYGYRAVVRADGDGQHPVEQIPKLLAALEADDADLVVGSRINQIDGTGLGPLARRLVKWYFTRIARLITGNKAPSDVNSGFFAFNRRGAEVLNRFHLERFPEPQIFILACREGLRVKEVFIEQAERRRGSSSLGLIHAARMFFRFNIFVIAEMMRATGRD